MVCPLFLCLFPVPAFPPEASFIRSVGTTQLTCGEHSTRHGTPRHCRSAKVYRTRGCIPPRKGERKSRPHVVVMKIPTSSVAVHRPPAGGFKRATNQRRYRVRRGRVTRRLPRHGRHGSDMRRRSAADQCQTTQLTNKRQKPVLPLAPNFIRPK